jgi:hypothetical protein
MQKYGWKLPEDQVILKDLVSELRGLSNRFYEITEDQYPYRKHEIKKELYRIKNIYLEIIPGEDIFSSDKEYFTASEILERIDSIRGKPVFKIFPETLEAMSKNRCPACGKEITEFRDEISRREFKATGICQGCQDRISNLPT